MATAFLSSAYVCILLSPLTTKFEEEMFLDGERDTCTLLREVVAALMKTTLLVEMAPAGFLL